MTISIIDFPTTTQDDVGRQDGSVGRSAFYLEECGDPLFAWLHYPALRESIDHGVVICPPIGFEQAHSFRSLRHLADQLALKSIPALRFDWHGTGDSPGFDEDPHRYRTWLKNVKQAVHWMREKLGCRRVSLVGLRMGATFASLATLENEIENLVLWSPVIKGRSYVREMKAISLTSDASPRRLAASGADVEAAGFVLNSETAADLSLVDLLKLRPKCRRALVVSRGEMVEDDRLCTQWATLGTDVRRVVWPGFADMMREPHRSRVPHRAINQLVEWLFNGVHAGSQRIMIRDESFGATSVSMPVPIEAATDNGRVEPIRESTLIVEAQPELFGIVSESVPQPEANSPVIVLLNSGATHHIGSNRLNVLMARRLAAQGFRCVRIDLGGLGDSVSTACEPGNNPYPATMFRDIDRVLKQIERVYDARRIVLMGLCSGAYAAFQSAAMIPSSTLVESILINPLTYFWREGMTLEDSPTRHLRSFHYYAGAAMNPMKWLRLVTGQTKIGIFGAMGLVGRQLKLVGTSVMAKSSGSLDRPDGELSHPEREDLPGDLTRIALTGRKLAMYFSMSDPGFAILNFHAARKARQMRNAGQLTIEFIDDADHTFTMRDARFDLIEAIEEHLRQEYQRVPFDSQLATEPTPQQETSIAK